MKCEICGEEKENRKGLSYHCSTRHNVKFEAYVLKYEHNDIHPLCRCGCGTETKFFGGKFMNAVQGHQQIGLRKSNETKSKISKTQKGKKLSSEHRENIAKAMKKNYDDGGGNIEKMNIAVRGTKWSNERSLKMGATRSARLASGEIVINGDKISASITQLYLDGGFQWSRGKHISPKLIGKKFAYYRSSWELRHMINMDSDASVKSYEYEPHVIYYEWQGKTRRYIPDFIVNRSDGTKELHEIGVKSLKEGLDKNIAKLDSAKIYCVNNDITFKIISF